MGSREDVAAKIDQETKLRIEDMNRAVVSHKEPVSQNTEVIVLQPILVIFCAGYTRGIEVSLRHQARDSQELPSVSSNCCSRFKLVL